MVLQRSMKAFVSTVLLRLSRFNIAREGWSGWKLSTDNSFRLWSSDLESPGEPRHQMLALALAVCRERPDGGVHVPHWI